MGSAVGHAGPSLSRFGGFRLAPALSREWVDSIRGNLRALNKYGFAQQPLERLLPRGDLQLDRQGPQFAIAEAVQANLDEILLRRRQSRRCRQSLGPLPQRFDVVLRVRVMIGKRPPGDDVESELHQRLPKRLRIAQAAESSDRAFLQYVERCRLP